MKTATVEQHLLQFPKFYFLKIPRGKAHFRYENSFSLHRLIGTSLGLPSKEFSIIFLRYRSISVLENVYIKNALDSREKSRKFFCCIWKCVARLCEDMKYWSSRWREGKLLLTSKSRHWRALFVNVSWSQRTKMVAFGSKRKWCCCKLIIKPFGRNSYTKQNNSLTEHRFKLIL